jgi:hypothetical protein
VNFFSALFTGIFCSALTGNSIAQTAQINASASVLSGSLFKSTNLVPATDNNYKATDVVGFVYVPNQANPWVQVPIQVDERDTVNCGQIYNTKSYVDTAWSTGYNTGPDPTQGYYSTFKTLQYCDINTFTGRDRYPAFDADDELAFMDRDLGAAAAPATVPPPLGVDPSTGVEAKNVNPITGKYVYIYLFNRLPSGGLVPSAHKSYITASVFKFTHNKIAYGLADYKSHYNIFSGPNPESSYVTTPYYHRGFADRWIDDTLKIDTGTKEPVNLYSNHSSGLGPGACARSEYTFSGEDTLNRPSYACNPNILSAPQAEGAFVTNIVGPIRAIRSYMGSNSGPLSQRTHVFYDQIEIITTYTRVHEIPGLINYYNYNPLAGTMFYNNNNNNPATQPGWASGGGLKGIVIDGVADSAWKNGPLIWEFINSAYGNIFRYNFINTDIPNYTPGAAAPTLVSQSYYLDDYNAQAQSSTDLVKCQCTGDGHAWGASGGYLTAGPAANGAAQDIPYTDPRLLTNFYNLTSVQANIYLPPTSPQTDTALWIKLSKNNVNAPPYTVTNWPKAYHTTTTADYMNLYPNPNNGVFTLEVFGTTNEKINVIFYNSLGRQIYSTSGVGTLVQNIDLRARVSGIYIVKAYVGANALSQKIIVTR